MKARFVLFQRITKVELEITAEPASNPSQDEEEDPRDKRNCQADSTPNKPECPRLSLALSTEDSELIHRGTKFWARFNVWPVPALGAEGRGKEASLASRGDVIFLLGGKLRGPLKPKDCARSLCPSLFTSRHRPEEVVCSGKRRMIRYANSSSGRAL